MAKNKPTIKKLCWCVNPDTNKLYPEGECPRLKERRHGGYWFRLLTPPNAEGKRRQPRYGPYPTLQEAKEQRDIELKRLHGEKVPIDPNMKYKDYLVEIWLERIKGLKSWSDYNEIARLYAIPALGYIKLKDLKKGHFVSLAEEMRMINRIPKGDYRPTEMQIRLLEARATRVDGEGKKKRYSTRPLTLSRIHKVIAVLRSSMTYLVKSGVLESNPAKELPLQRPRKHKPLIWTKGRIARWRATGQKPSKVMVWTPQQAGRFLDSLYGHRLYALYHLTLLTGLRRSEVLGLRWSEVDLEQGWMMIRETITDPEAQADDEEDLWEEPDLDRLGTKSEAGERHVSLSESTVLVLRAWRSTQNTERLKAGKDWQNTGLVFTLPDGRQLHPQTLADHFARMIQRFDLPPITFHGMRHSSATAQLAANVEPKIISQTLGHSRTSFTMDTYAHVTPELQQGAAEATDAVIPRKRRRGGHSW